MGRYLQFLAVAWMRTNRATAKELAAAVGVTGAQIHDVISFARGAGPKTVRGFAALRGVEEWELRRDAAAWEAENPVPLDGPVDLENLGASFRDAVERNPGRWSHDEIKTAVAARGSDGFASMTPEGIVDFIDSVAQANRRANREAQLIKTSRPHRVLSLPPKPEERDEVAERRALLAKKKRRTR